jgi:hypothetical protein
MKNSDWWWIDYMENELDPTTHPDIEFLLEKSPADREEFEAWRLLKSWVREVDPVKKETVSWETKELEKLREKTLRALADEETCQIGVRSF